MMDIPEDLATLKRPALQKLCKKLGIRANVKNAEMITALEGIRNNKIEESVPDSTSEGTTTNVRSTNKKESGEEGHVATPTSPVPDVLSEGVKVENNTRRTSEATSIARSEARRNLNEDGLVNSSGSRQSRKRQRTSSLTSAEAVNYSDVKKARLGGDLDTPTVSDQGDRLGVSKVKEEPRECFKVDDKVRLSFEANSSCSEVAKCAAAVVSKTPERTQNSAKFESTFSPPSGRESSIQRKRKRNLTYTKDGEEKQGDSPPEKKQRRSTYEVLPPDSLTLVGEGTQRPSGGPCDSTIAAGNDRDTPAGVEMEYNLHSVETEPVVPPSLADGRNERESNVKEDLMSLLEKRVTERKADPNYVSAHNGIDSRIPVKSDMKNKFDRAHNTTFNKMKSIATCYQEGVARQKSLGEASHKKPSTPVMASLKKERRVSLTSKARAKMRSVTPSKPVKKVTSGAVSAKKPWERVNRSGATVFKPAATTTAAASYNFSSSKTVKFEGALKTKNTEAVGMKRAPVTPGNNKTSAKQELQMKAKTIAAKARKSGKEAEREDTGSKSRKSEAEKRDRQKEDLVSNEKKRKKEEKVKNKLTLQASKRSLEEEIAEAFRVLEDGSSSTSSISPATSPTHSLTQHPNTSSHKQLSLTSQHPHTPHSTHQHTPTHHSQLSLSSQQHPHTPRSTHQHTPTRYSQLSLPSQQYPLTPHSTHQHTPTHFQLPLSSPHTPHSTHQHTPTHSSYEPSFSENILQGLCKKIDKVITQLEDLTERVDEIENKIQNQGDTEAESSHIIGGNLRLTKCQFGTLKCTARSRPWTHTLWKLLCMLYTDEELKNKCSVGKKGGSNMAMDHECMGIMRVAVKKLTVTKRSANENSPVQLAAKRRQTFDLKASLKKKNSNYKPYTGKILPVKKK